MSISFSCYANIIIDFTLLMENYASINVLKKFRELYIEPITNI